MSLKLRHRDRQICTNINGKIFIWSLNKIKNKPPSGAHLWNKDIFLKGTVFPFLSYPCLQTRRSNHFNDFLSLNFLILNAILLLQEMHHSSSSDGLLLLLLLCPNITFFAAWPWSPFSSKHVTRPQSNCSSYSWCVGLGHIKVAAILGWLCWLIIFKIPLLYF